MSAYFNHRANLAKANETGKDVSVTVPYNAQNNDIAHASGAVYDTTANRVLYGQKRQQISTQVGKYYTVSSRTYTREDLHHFVVRYTDCVQSKKSNNCIELVGKDFFSPSFMAIIGNAHSDDIYGPEDEFLRDAIFESLIEIEASYQLRSDNNWMLRRLQNVKEPGFTLSLGLDRRGAIYWSINNDPKRGESLVELLSLLFNLSRRDAVATAANVLNIDFANVYQFSSDVHIAESGGKICREDAVPGVLCLTRLHSGVVYANFVRKINILGNAGQVIGAICIYRLGEREFCMPATVGNGTLCIGRYKPTAHLLNQHLMDKYPNAPVVFCQDMHTALALHSMFDEFFAVESAAIIVTAHLGDDLSVLPWAYLYGHDVIFICTPTKKGLAMTKAYMQWIIGAKARSFKVLFRLILRLRLQHSVTGSKVDGLTSVEEELLNEAIYLSEVERPSVLLNKLTENAVSYKKFLEIGQEKGIFKVAKSSSGIDMAAGRNTLKMFDPSAIVVTEQAISPLDVTVQEIFSGLVFIHGEKDAGKSHAGLAVSKCLIEGGKLWGFFLSQHNSNSVVFVDSETPAELFAQRLRHYALTEQIGSSFYPFSKFGHNSADCDFDLANERFLKLLERILLERKCNFLVLDNLTSLVEDGKIYQPTGVSPLFKWFDKLQKYGITVIIVHHTAENTSKTPETATMRGVKEFTTRAHTEIVIIGQAQIRKEKCYSGAVQNAANQDGLTFGLCFKVCKTACILQKKIFWLHLPLGASAWQPITITGADGTPIELKEKIEEISALETVQGYTADKKVVVSQHDAPCPPDASTNPSVNLSEEEQKVYTYIKEKGSIKNADVRNLLDCEETKALAVLNDLEKRGLIERHGKGPATKYIYKCS